MAKELAVHEKLEVHEMLLFKTSCLTKTAAMLELAKDEKLRALMEEDVKNTVKAIEDLKKLIQ